MRTHWRIWLMTVAVAAWAMAAPPAGADPATVKAEGSACVVESTVGDEKFCQTSALLIDAAMAQCQDFLQRQLPEGARLRLTILKTAEELSAAHAAYGGGAPLIDDGFVAAGTLDCYVRMRPRVDDEYRLLGKSAPSMEVRVIEEAARACMRALIPAAVDWPDWLERGLPAYMAYRHCATQTSGANLWAQMKHVDALTLGSRDELLAVEKLLSYRAAEGDRKSRLDLNCEYLLFLRFLREDPAFAPKMPEFVKQWDAMGSAEESGLKCRDAFHKTFGVEFAKANETFGAWLGKLPVDWIVYQPDAKNTGESIELIAPQGKPAFVIRAAPLAKASWSLGGTLRIRETGYRQADVIFGFGVDGYYKASFVAMGWVSIQQWKNRQWETLASKPCETLKTVHDTGFSWAVMCKDGKVAVTVGDQFVVGYVFPEGARLDGQWGLGAHDAVVEFRELKVNKEAVPLK